jgi:hypothetical protein
MTPRATHVRVKEGIGVSWIWSLAIVIVLGFSSPFDAPRPSTAVPKIEALPSQVQLPPVDAALSEVASDFSQRLTAKGHGRLLAMSVQDGVVESRWWSATCDWDEPEIIDLIDSVSRGFTGEVSLVEGVRECGGTIRRYVLNERGFRLYHTGRISNPKVLKYLIETSSESR